MKTEYNIGSEFTGATPYHIITDTVGIDIIDNNLKPHWVSIPAKYTEFHIKRKKRILLLVIGESWTYGETIKGIATGIGKFNFYTQLSYSVGPRMATMLNADLYQYAVPGNCNFYMFTELDRILKYVNKLDYDKIYVCMQMTEPSREESLITQLKEYNHPLQELINPIKRIKFDHWLEKYDDIFYDQYESTISKYNNLECVLWKNFCRTNSKDKIRTFQIVEKTWIQYSADLLGTKLDAPSFYSIGWVDSIMSNSNYSLVDFDKSLLLKEMDIIEQSNNFIKANPLHSHHPNELAHILWARFLLASTGWKNGI